MAVVEVRHHIIGAFTRGCRAGKALPLNVPIMFEEPFQIPLKGQDGDGVFLIPISIFKMCQSLLRWQKKKKKNKERGGRERERDKI